MPEKTSGLSRFQTHDLCNTGSTNWAIKPSGSWSHCEFVNKYTCGRWRRQMTIWKIIYLNWGEKYEVMINHHSYKPWSFMTSYPLQFKYRTFHIFICRMTCILTIFLLAQLFAVSVSINIQPISTGYLVHTEQFSCGLRMYKWGNTISLILFKKPCHKCFYLVSEVYKASEDSMMQ